MFLNILRGFASNALKTFLNITVRDGRCEVIILIDNK